MIQYWILFNLVISLYELYCYNNYHKLGINNKNNIILDSWSEYSRVDPRYIINSQIKGNDYTYVWNFELFNVFNTILLTIFYLTNKQYNINIILISQLLATSLYFSTLLITVKSNKEIKEIIVNNSTYTKRMLYYFISSIWILVPLYFLSK